METHELAVPLIAQQTPYWCWAASAQMVLVYYGAKEYESPKDQCRIASVHGVDCCSDGHCDDPDCRAGDPKKALDKFGPKYNVPLNDYPSNQKISFKSICSEIDNKCPIIVVWLFKDDEGKPAGFHSVVVVGYEIIGTKRFVIINNPAPVGHGSRCAISYECFSKQYVSQLFCSQQPEYGVDSPAPTAVRKTEASPLERFQRIAVQRVRARVDDVHRVGEPIRVVALADLHQDKPQTSQLIYPVLTRQEHVLTTFELSRDDESEPDDDPTWNLCCVGGDDLYHCLSDVRRAHASRSGLEPPKYFAVSEPSLGLWFVGVERDDGIALIPVSDVRAAGWSAGIEVEWAEVIEKLQPLVSARRGV